MSSDPDPHDQNQNPTRLSRSDMADLRRAARERWGVPDLVKTEVLFQLARLLASDLTSKKTKVAAARTIGALDRIDQADEKEARKRESAASAATMADLVAEAEAAAEAHRPDEAPPGGSSQSSVLSDQWRLINPQSKDPSS